MPPEQMQYDENDMARFYYDSGRAVHSCIKRFCEMAADCPLLIMPFKGNDEQTVAALSRQFSAGRAKDRDHTLPFSCDRVPAAYADGYYLLPTVRKTSLFYHQESDCFFKILHALTFKNKIVSMFSDRARHVYELTEHLRNKGFQVPRVHAYGMFRKNRAVFYIMERIKGNSLYDILVKKKETLPEEMYVKVIHAVAALHSLGYWFGDLRAAHIFVHDREIAGFADIDSIKKNVPFRLKHIAKDLAGLNQPGLPLQKDEKMTLFEQYISKSHTGNKPRLLNLIRHYSERRWGT
jgi:tRNA A-37 threonylcarbamoyl transferase component Bud32